VRIGCAKASIPGMIICIGSLKRLTWLWNVWTLDFIRIQSYCLCFCKHKQCPRSAWPAVAWPAVGSGEVWYKKRKMLNMQSLICCFDVVTVVKGSYFCHPNLSNCFVFVVLPWTCLAFDILMFNCARSLSPILAHHGATSWSHAIATYSVRD
jgi:hypothetical protein